MPIITSLSTRFFGHPRLTNPTFGIQCGPLACCETHNSSTRVAGAGTVKDAVSASGTAGIALRRGTCGEGFCGRGLQAAVDYLLRQQRWRTKVRRYKDSCATLS